MKLIDILVQELPKRGGWPKGVDNITQYPTGELCFNNRGGTFFAADTGVFLDKAFDSENSGWAYGVFVTREQYESALSASKDQNWDGVGLPPVGCECEWQDKNTKHWTKVSIVYSSEWVTVIREDKIVDAVEVAIENYGDENRRQFRPIRTKAERNREDAVKVMNKEWSSVAGEFDDSVILKDIYGVIYDAIAAGKIPGVYIK